MKQIDYYVKCLNRDGSVDYIGGTEKNESLAIKRMKMVIEDNKGRVFEAYFIIRRARKPTGFSPWDESEST